MIGVLNPASAVPIAAGNTAQENTFESGGSINGSILGMITDKKDNDSIESEPSEEAEDDMDE